MFDSKFFEIVANKRILVAGDVMLDKFYLAKLDKFSSDAPIPVAKITRREASPGGAANVARCLAALGVNPLLAGFVGRDHNCESLMELLYKSHTDTQGLFFTEYPTTTKVRVVAKNHQVFRLDFEVDTQYPDELFEKLLKYIHNRLNHTLDAVVIADYEKGVCTEHFCQAVIADCHSHGTPVIILPYGVNWIKYQHADYIVPNVAKLNKILLSPISPSDDDASLAAAHYVSRKFAIRSVLATRSGYGLTLASPNISQHFRTKQQLLIDPAGAADAVCAATTLAIAAGVKLEIAAKLSNIVAGIAVSKPGSYAPTVLDVIYN